MARRVVVDFTFLLWWAAVSWLQSLIQMTGAHCSEFLRVLCLVCLEISDDPRRSATTGLYLALMQCRKTNLYLCNCVTFYPHDAMLPRYLLSSHVSLLCLLTGSNTVPPKIYVHLPRLPASKTVHWWRDT